MRLSIITVNFNNGDGLEKTIKSVIQQRYKDYEYIIIDGASKDNSVKIIQKYSGKIDYWVSEPDKGIYDAMNKSIAVAKGDYCIFMNSGDCFYDDNVLNNIFKTINSDVDFIAGNYCVEGIIKKAPSQVTAMTLFKTLDTSICHQALFTKREILINNPYQTEYKIVADFVNQFHSLVINNASYKYVDITICNVEPNGLSAVNYQRLASEKDSYLQSALPNRIYDDYVNFMCIKLIDYQYNELYSLLNKYNFSTTDIKISTTALKFAGFLKRIKVKFFKVHIHKH